MWLHRSNVAWMTDRHTDDDDPVSAMRDYARQGYSVVRAAREMGWSIRALKIAARSHKIRFCNFREECDRRGLPYDAVRKRIERGSNISEALCRPLFSKEERARRAACARWDKTKEEAQ